MGAEDVAEFVGVHASVEASNEETAPGCVRGASAASTATAAAAVGFEARVIPGPSVFSDVFSEETCTCCWPLRKERLRRTRPALPITVERRSTFTPSVAVRQRSEGALIARRATEVPVTVLFGVEGGATMLAKGVQHAITSVLPHVRTEHGVHSGHGQPAHVTSTQAVADLMQESIHNVRDANLSAQLGGDGRLALAFDGKDHDLRVLLLHLVHGGDDAVTDVDVDDVASGKDADHTVGFGRLTDDRGDQVVAVDGNTRSSSLAWVVPDLRAGRDEARRHGITSCGTEGAARLPLAASFSMRLSASTSHKTAAHHLGGATSAAVVCVHRRKPKGRTKHLLRGPTCVVRHGLDMPRIGMVHEVDNGRGAPKDRVEHWAVCPGRADAPRRIGHHRAPRLGRQVLSRRHVAVENGRSNAKGCGVRFCDRAHLHIGIDQQR